MELPRRFERCLDNHLVDAMVRQVRKPDGRVNVYELCCYPTVVGAPGSAKSGQIDSRDHGFFQNSRHGRDLERFEFFAEHETAQLVVNPILMGIDV